MILCCGEALIDMLPVKSAQGQPCFMPCPGGSPYNVAIALARLVVPTAFLSPLSTDFFGDQLVSTLVREGVDVSLVRRVAKPTTLGFVQLEDSKEPQYAFFFNDTADRSMTPQDLPVELAPEINCLQFGSISLTMEPGAGAIGTLVAREASRIVVSFDPNVRPSMIPDRKTYLCNFRNWAQAATIIKVSAADLSYLFPGGDTSESMEQLATVALETRGQRPLLIVITLGGEGSLAFLHSADTRRQATADGFQVQLADTIGAGDTFHSGLLAWLQRENRLSFGGLASLSEGDLVAMLRYGNACAALACTRSGADPPTKKALDDFLTKK